MSSANKAPVGPIPEGWEPDVYDRLRRRVLWSMPSGLYLLGTRDGDLRNLMTINLAVQVSTDPKLVGVSVEVSALSHQLLRSGGVFALSLLAREQRALVRAFVKPAEWNPDAHTLNGEAVIEAQTGAPILEQAAAWLDCAVRDQLSAGSHTFFVGEVMAAGEGRAGSGGDLLRMEDTRMNYGG